MDTEYILIFHKIWWHEWLGSCQQDRSAISPGTCERW